MASDDCMMLLLFKCLQEKQKDSEVKQKEKRAKAFIPPKEPNRKVNTTTGNALSIQHV